MGYYSLICAGLMALLGVYCGYLEMALSGAERNVEIHKKASEDNRRALEALRVDLERSEAALASREAEMRDIEQKAEALDARLREAVRDGKNAEWADMPVPPAVRMLLSGTGDQDRICKGDPADGAPHGNARAQVDGQKQ